MKEKKVKLVYVGDQVDTTLFYGRKKINNLNNGDEVEVPEDVSKTLLDQGKYKLAGKKAKEAK